MGRQLVQDRLELPPFGVQRGELLRGGGLRIEDGAQTAAQEGDRGWFPRSPQIDR